MTSELTIGDLQEIEMILLEASAWGLRVEVEETAEKYIKLVYSLDEDSTQEKRDALKFVYVESPFQVQEYLNLYASCLTLQKNPDKSFDKETIEHAKNNSRYYSLSYYTSVSNYTWVSFFKYFERIGILQNELFKNYSDLFIEANLYEWAKLEDRAVVCRKPKYIKRDQQGRLHSINSPAVEWINGDKHYFVKGIEVPDSWIEDKITLKDIKDASNAELRRIAMELYGYKEYYVFRHNIIINKLLYNQDSILIGKCLWIVHSKS
jgi:hypothetical protein